MNTLLLTLDPRINFWIANPDFLSVTVFNTLYDDDKSKNKDSSSQVMWAVAHLVDMNTANVWRNLPEADKKKLIAEDLLKNKKFDWAAYQNIIDEYTERVLSIAEKMLRNFQLKLVDRQHFIDTTAYDMENADQLDKMMINTSKIYSQYESIQNIFELEKSSGKTRGGIKESAGEKGII